jgi:flagellar motor switch protein FliN/FliY
MNTSENIALLADVPLDIEVSLDSKMLSLRELLRLSPGSVLTMQRCAGENIDLRVGGITFAFGEIVIIENSMGVRITDFNSEYPS